MTRHVNQVGFCGVTLIWSSLALSVTALGLPPFFCCLNARLARPRLLVVGSRDTDPAVSDPTVDVESKSQPPQKSVRLAGLDMLPETDRGKDMDATTSPAERLEGLTLKSGWFIEKLLVKPKGATGGTLALATQLQRTAIPPSSRQSILEGPLGKRTSSKYLMH